MFINFINNFITVSKDQYLQVKIIRDLGQHIPEGTLIRPIAKKGVKPNSLKLYFMLADIFTALILMLFLKGCPIKLYGHCFWDSTQ